MNTIKANKPSSGGSSGIGIGGGGGGSSNRPSFSINKAVNNVGNKRRQTRNLQRQNSWQAWDSRVTAPFVKLNLVIQCERLPKKDSFSEGADAFCGVWEAPMGFVPTSSGSGGGSGGGKGNKQQHSQVVSRLPTKQEREVGRTEVVRGSKNPTFSTTFRLEYKFQQEQTYILRVYDEDLKYATDLKEHDYIGGTVFTLGELMGGAGCTIARPLHRGKAYAILTGQEIVEAREVLEFRFSGQDLGLLERTSKGNKLKAAKDAAKDVLETMQKVNVAKTVLDKFDVFFRLEKLNPEDLTWSVVWKSEVVRDCQNPTWNVARIPLQLICDDEPNSPLLISIWVWNRFTPDELVGNVETTVSSLVQKAKRGIPVFDVMLEKKRFFGGTTQKKAGILKVLKSNILQIPSMVQYLSGGCELDLMVAVDCTAENGYWRDEDSLHYSSKSWLNDYQAVLFRIGSIFDAYEGRDFHMMGYGAKAWQGKPHMHSFFQIGERVQNADDLVRAYDRTFSEETAREKTLIMSKTAEMKHVIQAAMFRAVNANKNGRQCYSTLVILTTGVISDLQDSIDAVCAAAEDAPLSIILIGIGKGDFADVHKLVRGESNNGVPLARDIMQFVSMSDFNGNARECVAEAFQNIQEQCVQHFTGSGVKPFPPKPVPDFTNEQIFGSNRNKKSSSSNGKSSKSRKRATKATC